MVGPVWDQLSVGWAFVSGLGRAEGPAVAPGWRCPGPRVVRAGWDHAPSTRVPRVPDRSDGDFDEYGGTASSDVASARRPLARVQHEAGRVGGGLQAQLDRDA